MAIIGGGGQTADDPIYVDTLESLFQVLAGDYYYIAFPEVYNGPKVLDYRSRGWITSEEHYALDIGLWNKRYRYIYFNNWTILGASVLDTDFFYFYISSSEYYLRFYDLTIKNMYVLANRNETMFLNTGYSGNIEFYNCKFSCTIDAQNNNAYFFAANSGGYGQTLFSNCSFNIEVVNTSVDMRCRVINRGAYNTIARNCIFKFHSIKWYSPGDSRDDALLSFYSLNFCKVTGHIDIIVGYSSEVSVVRADAYCSYNAVEIGTKTRQNDRSIGIRIPSGTNVIKSDVHVKSDGVTLNTVNYDSNHSFLANSSQYVDADYLNQHSFLVGTAPAT